MQATCSLLITGGTGYLGAELVRQALDQGCWDVAATTFSRQPVQAGARYVTMDLADPQQIDQVLDALRPAVVIHTAYRQADPQLWEVTAAGTGFVARAARRVGARLIHLSSDVVFDGEQIAKYTEQDEPNPITPYGAAKAEAERLVSAEHPEALIVRTSLIYGGHELSKHEQFVLDAVDGRIDVAFFTDEIRCPIQVGDLARALLELARLAPRGILHVAGADIVSRYEFACLVAAAHGRPAAAVRSALSATSGMRRPRNCALDSSLAQSLVRTRLRGIRAVLAQHADHGGTG